MIVKATVRVQTQKTRCDNSYQSAFPWKRKNPKAALLVKSTNLLKVKIKWCFMERESNLLWSSKYRTERNHLIRKSNWMIFQTIILKSSNSLVCWTKDKLWEGRWLCRSGHLWDRMTWLLRIDDYMTWVSLVFSINLISRAHLSGSGEKNIL